MNGKRRKYVQQTSIIKLHRFSTAAALTTSMRLTLEILGWSLRENFCWICIYMITGICSNGTSLHILEILGKCLISQLQQYWYSYRKRSDDIWALNSHTAFPLDYVQVFLARKRLGLNLSGYSNTCHKQHKLCTWEKEHVKWHKIGAWCSTGKEKEKNKVLHDYEVAKVQKKVN